MGTGTAHYAHEDRTWILKLAGDVRHDLAPAVNALLDRAFADPAMRHFLIDLSEAHAIDSTSLGLLARIAHHLSARELPQAVVIAPGIDIQTTLRAVCFDRVFRLVTENAASGAPLEPLTELDASEREVLALVLDAHRRLCAIEARNRDVFRDVIELLERELGDRD
jgi:anti-anti-sigma factor